MRNSIFTLAIVCLAFVSNLNAGFNAVVALGDSLSRNPGGERSPLTSELVAGQLDVPLTSYASSGASSTRVLTEGQHTRAAANFGSGDLATFWIGGNDFFTNSSSIVAGDFGFLDRLENNVDAALITLRASGLEVVVLNLPDMGLVPRVATSNSVEDLAQFTLASQQWANRLDAIAAMHSVVVVDVFSTFNDLYANPQAFAVNDTVPILGPMFDGRRDCPFCMFSDRTHPSSLAMGFAAIGAIEGINNAFDSNGSMPVENLNESRLLALTGFVVSPDFDQDGSVDVVDVDALVAELASGGNDLIFDLTGDAIIDSNDLDQWLVEAGRIHRADGQTYLYGDADLDGVVDVGDFEVWNNNRFSTVAAWSRGDFTADGFVDVSDFNQWNSNKFSGSFSTIPEPAAMELFFGLLMLIMCWRRSAYPLKKD